MMAAFSVLEALFWEQLAQAGLAGACERDVRFHPERKWRFDFAWPERKLAIEIEGGIWSRGSHGRGTGIERDIEKGNAAVMLGWRVLRATSDMVNDGSALELVKAAFTQNGQGAAQS